MDMKASVALPVAWLPFPLVAEDLVHLAIELEPVSWLVGGGSRLRRNGGTYFGWGWKRGREPLAKRLAPLLMAPLLLAAPSRNAPRRPGEGETADLAKRVAPTPHRHFLEVPTL